MPAINFSTFTGFARWEPGCWLHVHGLDAESFLQGQFTADLRTLDHEPAVYGLWLTVKGKVLADSFVLRTARPPSFWVGSYASAATVIRERLESHIIADDVVVEDATAEWSGLSLLGDPAGDPPVIEGAFVFPGRRSRAPNLEVVGPAARIAQLHAVLRPLPELDPESLARIRILDGIPAVPADVGPGDLPNEGGLDADAISYTKGCYLGQEVMARLRSLGQIRRRLRRVRGEGAVPATPAPLFAGGRQVGELRTAARDGSDHYIGMAMLSLLHVGNAAKLALAPGAETGVILLDVT